MNKHIKYAIEVELVGINVSNTEIRTVDKRIDAIIQYLKDGLIQGLSTDLELKDLINEIKITQRSVPVVVNS